ncbi:HAD-IC family P-type ATPase [Roseibacillus persicicus]|uniref:heavy metal translocating P-type ATPase n=1 Tax=Roseibacillus persicicus TaxID=454148 RepID=UPI00398AF3FF
MSCCCSSAPEKVEPSCCSTSSAGQSFPLLRWLRLGLAILLAGLSMTLSLALNLDPPGEPTRTILHTSLAAITGAGLLFLAWPILKNALVPRLTLEHLYLLGLVGAYAASLYSSATGIGHIYYEVVLVLLAIYHLGQLVLHNQTQKASDLAQHIPGLATTATLVEQNQTRRLPTSEIQPGQILRIAPGEVIPADGTISTGSAFVEELAHTGEPFPAAKGPGDTLLAGSRVLDGTIDLATTSSGKNRELDRLLAACENTPPTPAENLAQRILTYFVPAVVAITLLTAAVWTFGFHNPSQALFNALAVTIVACPCALGLAIPLAARKALLNFRLLGLIPHQPDLAERLATVDTVAFDKTGTLSHPRLTLDKLSLTESAPPGLSSWLATIQRQSTHPVARPFWKLDQPADLKDLEIIPLPARGIQATFKLQEKAHTLLLGNSQLLGETTGGDPQNTIRTLHLILDGTPVATAYLTESPRDSSLQTLTDLSDRNLRLELLTGDTSCPESYRQLLDARTGLTTAEKAEIIQSEQSNGHKILYLGDGLNDTQALRTAHAGIALGSGSQAAASTAHATLTHDDLAILPAAIDLARATRQRLTRLLAFSLGYNAIGIALAATGWLHPVVAAFLMLASSMTVLTLVNRKITPQLPGSSA